MSRTVTAVVLGAAMLIAAGAYLFAAGAAGAPREAMYVDAAYGFSLQPPAFPKADKGTVVPAMFFAPSYNGFSNNVTMMIRNVSTNRDVYRKELIETNKANGTKMISDRDLTVSGKDACLVNAENTQKEHNYRYLSLAVFDTNRVYILTCTATLESYPKMEKEFMACVDSFALPQ